MVSVMRETVKPVVHKLCHEILSLDNVQFVGIIDKMGNLILEKFKDQIVPFEDDAKRRMLYMQMVLEISMRREFDSSLGSVNYVASHRKKGLMISIPFDKYVILVSGLHGIEVQKIISKVNNDFGEYVSRGNN